MSRRRASSSSPMKMATAVASSGYSPNVAAMTSTLQSTSSWVSTPDNRLALLRIASMSARRRVRVRA